MFTNVQTSLSGNLMFNTFHTDTIDVVGAASGSLSGPRFQPIKGLKQEKSSQDHCGQVKYKNMHGYNPSYVILIIGLNGNVVLEAMAKPLGENTEYLQMTQFF